MEKQEESREYMLRAGGAFIFDLLRGSILSWTGGLKTSQGAEEED